MPRGYRAGKPFIRKVSYVKRKGRKVPVIAIEGLILSKNKFKAGDKISMFVNEQGDIVLSNMQHLVKSI